MPSDTGRLSTTLQRMPWASMSRFTFIISSTGQTLVRYVNEMRVGYACKLLQEGAPSITQVCFDCGFNNLSNFNRFFKNRMGVNPREYLAVFQENGVQSPGKEA